MKKKMIFVLMLLVASFFETGHIYSWDIKTKPSGQNINLCNSCCTTSKKTNCIKNCSQWCNNGDDTDDVVTWTSTGGTTLFCLDKGKHMSFNTELTLKTNDTQASNFACRVKKLYEASYTNISFADFVTRLNDGDNSNINYRSTFMTMQDKIWDKNFKNDCLNLTVTNYSKKNGKGKIGLVNKGTTSSGDYYVTEITVNLNSVTSYEIELSGEPNGSFVSASINGTQLDLKQKHSSTKLYVHIPKFSNSSNIKLQLIKGSYIKNSGNKYIPKVIIYETGKENWQRLGKVGYTSTPFTEYGHDVSSNELSLKIDSCDIELSKIKNDPLTDDKRNALVTLYRDLIASGDGEHKGLLNFFSPSCGGSTCSKTTNSHCLSAEFSKSSNFSADNISCFDSTLESNGKIIGYCQTKFSYTSIYANAFNNKTISIKSGKKISGVLYPNPNDDTEKIIGNGIVTKTCYSYGASNLSETFVDSNKYSDYIGLIKFNDKELKSNVGTLNSLTLKRSTINPYEYIGTNQASYYFPEIYALNGSGEITKPDSTYLTKSDCETSVDGETTTYYTCKFLGYGVISKFLDVGEINIPFSINLKGSLKGLVSNDTATASCNYNATPELITPPPNPKLNLVFRTINTNVSDGTNAFLDKFGNVREAKSNWKDKENIIVIKNNSYNKTNDGPKYTIKLNPSDIKNIRKYNKKTSYDDYTLYCDSDGNNCKSRFLDGLQSGTLNFYNTSTERESYVGVIQNKLTINESIVLN